MRPPARVTMLAGWPTAVRGPSSMTINREVEVDWIWEILRYVAAWGGTGLIIWFWYWMFSNIGTF